MSIQRGGNDILIGPRTQAEFSRPLPLKILPNDSTAGGLHGRQKRIGAMPPVLVRMELHLARFRWADPALSSLLRSLVKSGSGILCPRCVKFFRLMTAARLGCHSFILVMTRDAFASCNQWGADGRGAGSSQLLTRINLLPIPSLHIKPRVLSVACVYAGLNAMKTLRKCEFLGAGNKTSHFGPPSVPP